MENKDSNFLQSNPPPYTRTNTLLPESFISFFLSASSLDILTTRLSSLSGKLRQGSCICTSAELRTRNTVHLVVFPEHLLFPIEVLAPSLSGTWIQNHPSCLMRKLRSTESRQWKECALWGLEHDSQAWTLCLCLSALLSKELGPNSCPRPWQIPECRSAARLCFSKALPISHRSNCVLTAGILDRDLPALMAGLEKSQRENG